MKPLKAEPPHLPLALPVANSNRTATHTATTARRKPGKCNRRKTLHKVLTFSWWFENSGWEKGERETSRKMGEMKMKAQTQRRRRNQYKHKLVKAYIDWERKRRGWREWEETGERGRDTHLLDAADETADAHQADYPVAVKQRKQQHKRMTAAATTGAATTISSASQGRNPRSCSHLP